MAYDRLRQLGSQVSLKDLSHVSLYVCTPRSILCVQWNVRVKTLSLRVGCHRANKQKRHVQKSKNAVLKSSLIIYVRFQNRALSSCVKKPDSTICCRMTMVHQRVKLAFDPQTCESLLRNERMYVFIENLIKSFRDILYLTSKHLG